MDPFRPTYRLKTNIPTDVLFESDEPQTGSGKFGPWFRYDVMVDGQEQVLFASKGLQDRLSGIGHLYDRVIEITKREGDNNRIFWEIKENGRSVIPAPVGPAQQETETPAPSEPPSLDERVAILERRLNTASSVVRELIDRVQNLEEDVSTLRERAGVRSEAAGTETREM